MFFLCYLAMWEITELSFVSILVPHISIIIMRVLHELKQQQVSDNYWNCSFAGLKKWLFAKKKKKKRVHEQQLQRRLLHRILLL